MAPPARARDATAGIIGAHDGRRRGGTTVLGRTTLHGANDVVSTEHIRVARHGVLVRVTDCSRNGTFVRRSHEKTWTRLAPGGSTLIAVHDALKLGDALELKVR